MHTGQIIPIIISITIFCALAVAYIYYIKESRKRKLLENQLSDLQKAGQQKEEQLSNQIAILEKSVSDRDSKIDTLQTQLDCVDIERSQNEAKIEKALRVGDDLRAILEANKMKMVDMLKHLQALQKSMFTEANLIKSMFNDFFVLFRPGEHVGGDFYKFYKKGDISLVACGNCGMSGINGLIKGLLNIVFLQEIMERADLKTIQAGQVLDALRSKYAHLAEKNDQHHTDEDIPVNFSVCVINEKERVMTYSGAYGSLCLVRKSYPGTSRKENDLHEYRGDRMNFAVSFGRRKNYNSELVELEKDDRIYLKTDGYVNQRGGSQNARFGDNYLRQLIMRHANEPMLDQKRAIEEEFNNWRGTNKANDILIIGLGLKVAGK